MNTESVPINKRSFGKESGALVMFEIRESAGDGWAFPYACLEWIRFNPSECILLRFPSHEVVIKGSNLNELYCALLQYRVSFVWERDAKGDDWPEGETFLTSIEVIPVTQEQYEVTEARNDSDSV
jgi:hypothetical protein